MFSLLACNSTLVFAFEAKQLISVCVLQQLDDYAKNVSLSSNLPADFVSDRVKEPSRAETCCRAVEKLMAYLPLCKHCEEIHKQFEVFGI